MNNEFKPRLKAFLESHRGRPEAITRREIKDTLDYHNDRKLRILIGEIRAEGLPVLFSTKKPAGYFVPATFEELRVGLDSFRSYVIALCVQSARIKHSGELYLKEEKQGALL